MPRLVSASEITGWAKRLRSGLADAADRQRTTFGAALRSHGAGWDTEVRLLPPGIWTPDTWASAVTAEVQPIARDVASEVLSTAAGRLPAKLTWGMPRPVDGIAQMALRPLLAAAPGFAGRPALTAAGRTLSQLQAILDATPDRYGGITHPEARQTVADAYASTIDSLNRLVDRVASQMGSAAQSVLASTVDRNQPQPVFNIWTTSGDDRVREDHIAAEGQEQRPGDPFDVGGEHLLYPGDPAGSDENVMNCVTAETVVVAPDVRYSLRRWYQGDLVTVRFARGGDLAVTPNHPVLRADGRWVPARELHEGDYCIGGRLVDVASGQPDVDHPPSEIGEIHRAAQRSALTERVRTAGPDLHGDAIADGEVDVVAVDRALRVDDEAATAEEVREFGFAAADAARPGPSGRDGRLLPVVHRRSAGREPSTGSARLVRGRRETTALLTVGATHPETQGVAASAGLDSCTDEPAPDDVAADAERSRERQFTLAVEVATDEVVGVDVTPEWAGWVYNLDTGHGWYLTDNGNTFGVLVGNCRCWLESTGGAMDDVTGTEDDFSDLDIVESTSAA